METVTSDDVKFYLNLGRQTAGELYFMFIFITLKVKVIHCSQLKTTTSLR